MAPSSESLPGTEHQVAPQMPLSTQSTSANEHVASPNDKAPLPSLSISVDPDWLRDLLARLREVQNAKLDEIDNALAEAQMKAQESKTSDDLDNNADVLIENLTLERDECKRIIEDYKKKFQVQSGRIFAMEKRHQEKMQAQKNLFDGQNVQLTDRDKEIVKLKARVAALIGQLSKSHRKDEKNEVSLPKSGERVEEVDEKMRSLQLGCEQDTLVDVSGFFEEKEAETITQERDEWKVKAEEYEKTIEILQKRLNINLKAHPDLSADVGSRLNSLERENQKLKTENVDLKGKLRDIEGENMVLSHENTGKSSKLRGANKKVQKEKSVAKLEKEKAQSAVNDKNERLKSERNWRKERNEARAAYEEQKKINAKLIEELEVERSGVPHLREDGTDKDDTTVAIPIEFQIYRGDFHKLKMIFDANRMKIKDQFVRWYIHWKKEKDEKVKVVGANYASDRDKEKKIRIGVDLYDDVTELNDGMDGDVYIPVTGAEHAGWRSKRGLENFCRSVQSQYNAYNN